MPHPFSAQVPELFQSHLDHLLKSGVSVEVIRERGYRTVMGKAALKDAGFSKSQQRAPGILIPLHAPDGSDAGFLYRPDRPRTNSKGKDIKYEAPRYGSLRLDMPPGCKEAIGNPSIPLWITEGAKKVDALASKRACAISLNGVWGFKGRNEFGATTLLADFDFIALKDRIVYLAFDSDSATNPHVRQALERLKEHLSRKGARILVINLPPGASGRKTGIDDYFSDGHTLDEAIALASESLPKKPDDEAMVLHHTLYKVVEERFCVVKNIRDVGKVCSPLCNFTAKISEEVIHDSGFEEERRFVIEGTLAGGKPLPKVDIPASGFGGMNWVTEKWGAGSIVYAGPSTKDHLRCMIQMTRNGSEPRRVFTHTGWRDIKGERFFLTNSGALGREGIDVYLKDTLVRYRLPTELEMKGIDTVEAMKASLRFMDFGRPEVMSALWAQMYLAPLTEILNPSFMLWLLGGSGAFKSVLSALALCHFGDFTYLTLPASWRDTANDLEWSMAITKDIPLVIDDWAPASSIAGQKDMEAKARAVIRAQGNRSGKGRLKPDSSPRERYIPRGLVVSSGEQLPGGGSDAARLFVLEVEQKDMDTNALSKAQKEAHLYKYAMGRYILWLKDNWEHIRKGYPERWEKYRNQVISEGMHLRLPAAIAWLYLGLDSGLAFAQEIGAIGREQAASRKEVAWRAFISLADRQGRRVEEERPSERFLAAFATLMDQGRIVVIDKQYLRVEDMYDFQASKPRSLKPNEVFVGWKDEEFFYLLPKAIYGAVYEFCNRSGEPFTYKDRAVWADLVRAGVSEQQDKTRHQVLVRIGEGREDSKVVRVVKLKASAITVKED